MKINFLSPGALGAQPSQTKMERSHRPPGNRQQQHLTREQQCLHRSTDLWMLSSVKPARTPWRRLEVERAPSPNRRCRSFPACSVRPDTADCSEGSAHRAAQENTLSCRGSAQAGTEIGRAQACLSERGATIFMAALRFHWR